MQIHCDGQYHKAEAITYSRIRKTVAQPTLAALRCQIAAPEDRGLNQYLKRLNRDFASRSPYVRGLEGPLVRDNRQTPSILRGLTFNWIYLRKVCVI